MIVSSENGPSQIDTLVDLLADIADSLRILAGRESRPS